LPVLSRLPLANRHPARGELNSDVQHINQAFRDAGRAVITAEVIYPEGLEAGRAQHQGKRF
jgi:hypothetical protein